MTTARNKEEAKYTGKQSLIKVENSLLPEYIINNFEKYKEWFD